MTEVKKVGSGLDASSNKRPTNWVTPTLGEVYTVVGGGTPSTEKADYWGTGTPWVTSADIYGVRDIKPRKQVTTKGIENSTTQIVPRKTLLVVTRVGLGKTAITETETCFSQDVQGLIQRPDLIAPEFTLYFLSYELQILKHQGRGTTISGITKKQLTDLEFPLPPYKEQQRIVAKIEELFSELDKGVENLRTAQQQLKIYRQTLLKHAFEGKLTADWRREQQALGKLGSVDETLKAVPTIPRPNRWKTRTTDIVIGHSALAIGNPETALPEGWRWVPMVDIARMESGHTPSRNHPEWWTGEIPWISIPDARQNHGKIILNTNQKINDQGLANSAARLLPTGTVCISRTASVGYVVELGRPMATSQDFVNWTPSNAVTSEWLRLVFGADRETLMRFGKGTTHKTIYFPEWLSVHIGLPSTEEQRNIVEVVDEKFSILDQLEQTITHSLQQADALRQSILKKAFSGQLVPQDPNDEPASMLLERLHAERAAQPKARGRKVKASA